MTRINSLDHEFVEYIPDSLDEGILYISVPFATALHLCCCGCGNEVVTPLDPTDWQLTFDGRSISLHPSIGNWSFDCQSHYWISRNQVRWTARLSKREIEDVRLRDLLEKGRKYGFGWKTLWTLIRTRMRRLLGRLDDPHR